MLEFNVEMYFGLCVKCPSLFDFSQNWNILKNFINSPVSNFMKICSVIPKLLHVDRPDEANRITFTTFHCGHSKKLGKVNSVLAVPWSCVHEYYLTFTLSAVQNN
jgi:hypothetical protein